MIEAAPHCGVRGKPVKNATEVDAVAFFYVCVLILAFVRPGNSYIHCWLLRMLLFDLL
jgi:hypothetical protein